MNRKDFKSKVVGVSGSVSGAGSVISAHNVCHALCLGVVAVLSVFGIVVASDVLMFLENFALTFWSMGLFFLAISLLLLYKYGKCISQKLILANAGLLTIGVPFPSLQAYSLVFYTFGGFIVATSFGWYLRDKGFLLSRKGLSKNIFLYVMIVIAISILAYSIYGVYTSYFGANYQNALKAENTSNPCATPQGYTEQEWKEHMSHHPDRYKDCLK